MPGMKNFADFGAENYRQVVAFLRQLRGEMPRVEAAVEVMESASEGAEPVSTIRRLESPRSQKLHTRVGLSQPICYIRAT